MTLPTNYKNLRNALSEAGYTTAVKIVDGYTQTVMTRSGDQFVLTATYATRSRRSTRTFASLTAHDVSNLAFQLGH